MLAAGTWFGILPGWAWWAILIGGAMLAVVFLRGLPVPRTLPRCGPWALLWILVGGCAGLWLAGAMRPPGTIGLLNGDAYDVLEYHLQLPREFYAAGRIGELRHNVYSYYPLGVEMLSLLAMRLRGGAYEGACLAKLLHGAFAVLGAAGVFCALRRPERLRGRFAVVLLASFPAVLYLSWLAFCELAVVCYLALAAGWLRNWLEKPSGRSAAAIGLMLGAACAMKYLAVAFVAAPVAAVMAVASVRSVKEMPSRKRLKHLALVAALTLVLFAPWLARNAAYTGNPVFPLATGVFGCGHWSAQQQQRWRDGHAPGEHPPVPPPPGWVAPPHESRAKQIWKHVITNPMFGTLMMTVLGASLAAPAISRRSAETLRWDLALTGVFAAQLAVWFVFTRNLPWRFLAPAVVPMVLLISGGLARLAEIKRAVPGGIAAAMVITVLVAVNLRAGIGRFQKETAKIGPTGPNTIHDIASNMPPAEWLGDRSRPDGECKLLLLGEAKNFYFPPETLYATVFDRHPLEACEAAGGPEILRELRRRGITHIFVNWHELWRLAGTYGCPASLSYDLHRCRQVGRPPTLGMLEDLKIAGLRETRREYRSAEVKRWAESADPAQLRTKSDPTRWDPFRPPPYWPVVSLYALPTE
jgi:hypothetical protein